MESIEALKEDIASYLGKNYARHKKVAVRAKNGTISTSRFEGLDLNDLESHLKTLWGPKNQITIYELNETYTNTPESIAQLKKDLEFYFSVKTDESPNKFKIGGTVLISILFYLQLLGIVIGIILCLLRLWGTGLWLMAGSFLYALVYNYLLDLGKISEIQENKILLLEKRLHILEKQGSRNNNDTEEES